MIVLICSLYFVYCSLHHNTFIFMMDSYCKILGLKVKYVPSHYEPEKHSQSEKLRQAAHCFTYRLCFGPLQRELK